MIAIALVGAGFAGTLLAGHHSPSGPIVSTSLAEPALEPAIPEQANEAIVPAVRDEAPAVDAEPAPTASDRARRPVHRASRMARAERGALARWTD